MGGVRTPIAALSNPPPTPPPVAADPRVTMAYWGRLETDQTGYWVTPAYSCEVCTISYECTLWYCGILVL
jgi:hypothetical protein